MNWRERKDTSQVVTSSQTFTLDMIPLDLKNEILMKLKAKQISKLIAVSKSWSSIVRRKDFTNLYLSRSMTQPRILLSIRKIFYTCEQEDPPSHHYRICCPSPHPKCYGFSQHVRGLISCLNSNHEVMIGNLSTCQFITLPIVEIFKKDSIHFFRYYLQKDIIYFFGYDPVADVYKVLCMTSPRRYCESEDCVSKDHQVFTLGDSEKKWKRIKCEHLYYVHLKTQGIYNNGVVYYLALIKNKVQSLVCFDVGSEKFNVIKLPIDLEDLTLLNYAKQKVVTDKDFNGTLESWGTDKLLIDVVTLSNYGGKIAVTDKYLDRTLDLWVLNASKQVWLKTTIVMPDFWSFLYVNGPKLRFIGTLGTGELIFSPSLFTVPYYLICYDPKNHVRPVRRIVIKGVDVRGHSLEVFLNHVESPMFLQL